MSKALEAIEKMACEANIKDKERISSIVNAFLEMDSRKLECPRLPENFRYRYLINDIGEGFELAPDKIAGCTISELLVLIGLEPDIPWFEIDTDEEVWFSGYGLGKTFFSANHCFALAQALLRVQAYEPVVNRFMKLNYRGFITYLADRINASDDHTDPDYSRLCMKKGMQLNKRYSITQGYMTKYGFGEDGEDLDDILTVGDVLSRACRSGSAMWLCGNEPLGMFVDGIVRAYEIVNFFFMNCLRELAISICREDIEILLDKCSEENDYEHFFELKFRDYFSSLIVRAS